MGNDVIQTCGSGTDYSFVYLNWGSYSAKEKKKTLQSNNKIWESTESLSLFPPIHLCSNTEIKYGFISNLWFYELF